MNIDQKFNFNFEVGEPKQKNNIVIFFLSSKGKMKDDLLTFPEALKNNLAAVEEVHEKGFIGSLKLSNKSDRKLLVLGSSLNSNKFSYKVFVQCASIGKTKPVGCLMAYSTRNVVPSF